MAVYPVFRVPLLAISVWCILVLFYFERTGKYPGHSALYYGLIFVNIVNVLSAFSYWLYDEAQKAKDDTSDNETNIHFVKEHCDNHAFGKNSELQSSANIRIETMCYCEIDLHNNNKSNNCKEINYINGNMMKPIEQLGEPFTEAVLLTVFCHLVLIWCNIVVMRAVLLVIFHCSLMLPQEILSSVSILGSIFVATSLAVSHVLMISFQYLDNWNYKSKDLSISSIHVT